MTREEMLKLAPLISRRAHVRLTFKQGKSDKFYEVVVYEELLPDPANAGQFRVLTWWGRRRGNGDSGDHAVEVFSHEMTARAYFDKKVRQKTAKGYVTEWYRPDGRVIDDEASVADDAIPTGKHLAETESDASFKKILDQRKRDATW